MMPGLPPHVDAVFQAITGAMAIERDDRIGYTFPVTGGRIVLEAAFIPDPPDTGEGIRLLPDLPKVERFRQA
jgi:hypothetical protein